MSSDQQQVKYKLVSPVRRQVQAVAPITIIKQSMVMTKLTDSGEKETILSPEMALNEDPRTTEIKEIISSITNNCVDETAQCSKKPRLSLDEEVKNGNISLEEVNLVEEIAQNSTMVTEESPEMCFINEHQLKINSVESLDDKVENGGVEPMEEFDYQNDIEEIVVEEISMEDFKPYEVNSSPDNTEDFQSTTQVEDQDQEQSQDHQKSIDFPSNLRDMLADCLSKPPLRSYSEAPKTYKFPSLNASESSPEASPTKVDQLTSNDSPDLIVKINQTEFNVHKAIFAARSAVFAEKFKAKPNLRKIEMKFVSLEVFEVIRDFIYASKIPMNNFEVLEEVFKQSTLLKIDDLRELTSTMLIQMLDYDNAMTIFQIGSDYDNAEMKLKAFEVVKQILPGQVEKEEQMNDLLILKELVKAKYLRKRKLDESG